MDSLVRIERYQWVARDKPRNFFLSARGFGRAGPEPRSRPWEAQDCSSGKFTHISDFTQSILLLDGGNPKARARAAISCRKLEIKLTCLMNNPSLPHAASWGPPLPGRFRDDKSARKNLLLKISCNPLISLDSDERIQGNPSFSNPHKRGFGSQTGANQETPNARL